jgi:hypothetical protein
MDDREFEAWMRRALGHDAGRPDEAPRMAEWIVEYLHAYDVSPTHGGQVINSVRRLIEALERLMQLCRTLEDHGGARRGLERALVRKALASLVTLSGHHDAEGGEAST